MTPGQHSPAVPGRSGTASPPTAGGGSQGDPAGLPPASTEPEAGRSDRLKGNTQSLDHGPPEGENLPEQQELLDIRV